MGKSTKDKEYQRYVSSIGIVLLDTLVERKNKEKKIETLLTNWSLTTLGCLLLGCIYGYYTFSSQNVQNKLDGMASNILLFVFIGILAVCLSQIKLVKKKLEKAEDEFDALRFEVIERSEELWDTKERWKNREKVYELMKNEYDVNLFHK
ncbi:DUF2663 family protein [Bacillus alkalicellulosilyticus]|uniref:DUF2663 family protein n=1 Tax=Alkalihalobacterium alkalicellulosilyticum TaxID=1912214 RepID=UPI000996B0F0|nr:DUF2663 family protein [Bacillus alkalicellulosilyticus]